MLVRQIQNSELEIAFVADHKALHVDNSRLRNQVLCQETLALVTAAEHGDVVTGSRSGGDKAARLLKDATIVLPEAMVTPQNDE